MPRAQRSEESEEPCPECGEPVNPTAVVQKEHCPECGATVFEILRANNRAEGGA